MNNYFVCVSHLVHTNFSTHRKRVRREPAIGILLTAHLTLPLSFFNPFHFLSVGGLPIPSLELYDKRERQVFCSEIYTI